MIYEKYLRAELAKKAELILFDQTGKDEHMKKREYAGRILLAAIAGVFLILGYFSTVSLPDR